MQARNRQLTPVQRLDEEPFTNYGGHDALAEARGI